jgi:hypothetical protein
MPVSSSEKRRLRKVHLSGYGLHPVLVRSGPDHDDCSGIAGEGPVGESIHDQETHSRNILRGQPRTAHVT